MAENDLEVRTNADGDLEVVIRPEIQQQMDADPKLRAAVQAFVAALHQAQHGVKTGQYRSLAEGVEAITGQRQDDEEGAPDDF